MKDYSLVIVDVLDALANLDDEERQEVMETVRQLFCMFCGKRHPKGAMCTCWDVKHPKFTDQELLSLYGWVHMTLIAVGAQNLDPPELVESIRDKFRTWVESRGT